MGTDKRARQKSNRQRAIEHEQAEEAKHRRNQRMFVYVGLAVVALGAIALVAWLLGNDDEESATDTAAPGETSIPADNTAPAGTAPSVAITVPPPGATITGETPCPPADGSAERTTTFENPPPMCIDETAEYTAEVETTEGTFVLALDTEAAPVTVNNFVVLSRYGYYDGVAFHRVIDDFMVQGGDAVGPVPGTGGPGYQFEDELPAPDHVYQPGELAMANSGPDTNGSQFFVVTRDDGVDWLNGSHSLFGRVVEGFDVVETLEALDSGDGTGTPSAEATIVAVTVVETPSG